MKKYQADIRYLFQQIFQYKIQKDAMEIKLNSYIEIEKELGIEIVGDTKVKISSIDNEEDTWEDLDTVNNTEEEINKINENYINEETIN